MAILDEMPYPKRIIDLKGPEGNAFGLMSVAVVMCNMLQMTKDEKNVILDDMKSGDYEHLIQTFDKHFGDYIDLVR